MKSHLSAVLSIAALSLVSCGGEESSGSRGIVQYQTTNGGQIYLAPVPSAVLAYDRSPDDENVIVPVARKLDPQQLEVHVQPEMSQDLTKVLSFVTGIGIEAIFQVQPIGGELQTIQLPIRMALRARRWDAKTESFSADTQIFAAQGMNLDRAQEFTINDPNDPNFVITGLGMLLREGKFSKLELKRTMLNEIENSNFSGGLSAANRIELPAGWIAVGLIIAVDKANSDNPPREPFVSDIRIHTGYFTRTSGL